MLATSGSKTELDLRSLAHVVPQTKKGLFSIVFHMLRVPNMTLENQESPLGMREPGIVIVSRGIREFDNSFREAWLTPIEKLMRAMGRAGKNLFETYKY